MSQVDQYGGYSDASGGYTDAYGGYSDTAGGYTDAYGNYADAGSVAAYHRGIADMSAALGLS